MVLITVLAFGTRGDVQPTVLIAKVLKKKGYIIRFVTHTDHHSWVRSMLFDSSESTNDDHKCDLELIDTPSIVERTNREDSEEYSQGTHPLWSFEQQKRCIEVCIGNHYKKENKNKTEKEEKLVLMDPADLILFNLFALEGLVIGDVTGIPAVALHPYPPPSMTSGNSGSSSSSDNHRQLKIQHNMNHAEYLKEEWPHLLEKLRLASAQDGGERCQSLTFEDFHHWVWPVVVSPHWFKFRQKVIRLANCLTLKKGITRCLNCVKDPLHSAQRKAPILLYGHSPLLFPTPVDRPHKVIDTGAWCLIPQETATVSPPPPPPPSSPPPPSPPSSSLSSSSSQQTIPNNEIMRYNKLPSKVMTFLNKLNTDQKFIYITLGAAWLSLSNKTAYFLGYAFGRAIDNLYGEHKLIIHFPDVPRKRKSVSRRSKKEKEAKSQEEVGPEAEEEGEEDEEEEEEEEESMSNLHFGISVISSLEHSFLSGYFELNPMMKPYPNKSTGAASKTTTTTASMSASLSSGFLDLSIEMKAQFRKQMATISQDSILLWRGSLSHTPSFFKQCGLVLHHGGSGTTFTCALHGVPQAPIPMFFDQFHWAEAVSSLKIGPEVPLNMSHTILSPTYHAGVNGKVLNNPVGVLVNDTIMKRTISKLTEGLAHALSKLTKIRASSFGARLRKSIIIDNNSSKDEERAVAVGGGGGAREKKRKVEELSQVSSLLKNNISSSSSSSLVEWCTIAQSLNCSIGVATAAYLIEKHYFSFVHDKTSSSSSSSSTVTPVDDKIHIDFESLDRHTSFKLEMLWRNEQSKVDSSFALLPKRYELRYRPKFKQKEERQDRNKVSHDITTATAADVDVAAVTADVGTGADVDVVVAVTADVGTGADVAVDVDAVDAADVTVDVAVAADVDVASADDVAVDVGTGAIDSGNDNNDGVATAEDKDDDVDDDVVFKDGGEDISSDEFESIELASKFWIESVGHEETVFLYDEIFQSEIYAGPLSTSKFMNNILSSIRPSDIVIDCGANIGMFTIWFHKKLECFRLKQIQAKVRAKFQQQQSSFTEEENNLYTEIVKRKKSNKTQKPDSSGINDDNEEDSMASKAACSTGGSGGGIGGDDEKDEVLFGNCVVQAGCRIICLEPAPITSTCLRNNLHRYVPHAIVIETAVVSKNEKENISQNQEEGIVDKMEEDNEDIVDDVDGVVDDVEDLVDDVDVVWGGGRDDYYPSSSFWGSSQLLFLTQIPGNSCLLQHNEKLAQQREFSKDMALGNNATQARKHRFDQLYTEKEVIPIRTLKLEKLIHNFVHNHQTLKTSFSLEKRQQSRLRPRIALLKIDVEGSELSCLEGLGNTWPLIDNLVAEVHDLNFSTSNFAPQHQESHKNKIDQLLRGRGKFSYIKWTDATPTQCESSSQLQNTPRNLMVYASRKSFI